MHLDKFARDLNKRRSLKDLKADIVDVVETCSILRNDSLTKKRADYYSGKIALAQTILQYLARKKRYIS